MSLPVTRALISAVLPPLIFTLIVWWMLSPVTLRLVAQSDAVTVGGGVKQPGEHPYEAGMAANAGIEKARGIQGDAMRRLTVMRITTSQPQPDVSDMIRTLSPSHIDASTSVWREASGTGT